MRTESDAERPALSALRGRIVDVFNGTTNKIHDDGCREPEGCQHEPGENERRDVVQHLQDEEELSQRVVTTLEHTTEVHERVDASREGTVQPSTSLGDEFWCTFGHVGLTLCSLDVGQMPLGASLGDEFETQNTILSQEHVLLEDAHTVNTLLAKDLGQSVITVEVLFERSAHNSAISVGRECTGQDGDVTERTLQGLVEDVTDLVLEVLSGDQWIDQILPAVTFNELASLQAENFVKNRRATYLT